MGWKWTGYRNGFDRRSRKPYTDAKRGGLKTMFVQIVDWLIKFVEILSDGGKLRSPRNRKKIGKSLLKLYTMLSEIAENAAKIRFGLVRVQDGTRRGDIPDFRELGSLLRDQRRLLYELQENLGDSLALVDVYGDNCGHALMGLIRGKFSLIDVIMELSLGGRPSITCLPRSLDLNDVEAFRRIQEEAERSGRHARYLRLKGMSMRGGNPFAVVVGGDHGSDEQVVASLLSQLDELNSVERLGDAQRSVAEILKTHFKIEELF
jgi:hypothetical protein